MTESTIGIVGGGQLGRMLTESATKLGLKVIVIDPTPDCPAAQVGAEQILADFTDKDAIRGLADKADFITIEFEHTDTAILKDIAQDKPVNPAPDTIRMIQDKYQQKKFLQANGFAMADFVEIENLGQAEKIFDEWGGKLLLKSKKEAYDGKGNALISNRSELKPSLEKFAKKGIYAEKFVKFKKELAVMAAKDFEGRVYTYPVVETVHTRNICIETFAPAQVSMEVTKKATEVAQELVGKLEGAGVFGIEMFLDEDDEILINEIAPRVHNSGHYTMDMFDVSQFEQHIRAITGMELKNPAQKHPACCMVNILGGRDGPVEIKGLEEAGKMPGVKIYLYGKSPTKVDRKMGHINAVADTIEEARINATRARKLISI